MGVAAVPQHPKVFRKKPFAVALWDVCSAQRFGGLSWAVLPSPGYYPQEGTWGAAVPVCPPVLGSKVGECAACLDFVYVLFVLFDAATAGSGESLFAFLFFEDTGRINTPQTVCSGH